MNLLKIAVNKSVKNKVFTGSDLTNKWENVLVNPDQLKELILAGYALCNSHLTSNVKKIENFLSSECLMLDYDNSMLADGVKVKSEPYYSLENFTGNTWIKNNAYMIYTSPSHTDDWHRFRIIFKLPKLYTSAEEYKKVVHAFINKMHSDPSPSSVTNAFFGNTDAQVFAYGHTLKEKDVEKTLGYKSQVEQMEKGYSKTNLNGHLTDDFIRTCLSAIPKKLDYVEWSKICHSINAAVDYDTDKAEQLITEWSPGKRSEVANKLKTPMKSIGVGTLIYYARQFGADIPKKLLKPELSDTRIDNFGIVGNNRKSVVQDIQDYLGANHEFRHNIVTGKYETLENGLFIPLTDKDYNDIYRSMDLAGVKASYEKIVKVIESNYTPSYDPIAEYFDSLPDWDNTERLLPLADCVKPISEFQGAWYLYWLIWMRAAYKCARFGTPNHYLIVLKGGQGIGKTSFWRSIIPKKLKGYYAEAQINPNDKDSKILISEKFLINLDELETSTREEIGHLKTLITSDSLSVRRPYGRNIEQLPRRSSFVGSVNKEFFLTDSTGSRRFLTVDLGDNDIVFNHEFDLDQVWAEVKWQVSKGMPSYFDKKQSAEIQMKNEKFSVVAPEEEMLADNYDVAEKGDAYALRMTTTEILNNLNSKTNIRLSIRNIGMALKKLGYQRVVERPDRLYKWLVKTKYNGLI